MGHRNTKQKGCTVRGLQSNSLCVRIVKSPLIKKPQISCLGTFKDAEYWYILYCIPGIETGLKKTMRPAISFL
jgi:hypothetical protein